MSKLISINPTNYQKIGEVEISSKKEIKAKVAAAQKVKTFWKEIGLKERIKLLEKVFQLFEKNQKEISDLVAKEIGMPVSVNKLMEVGEGIHFFRWFLDNAPQFLAPEITFEDKASSHTVYHEPFGVAAVIAPWNFPFSNFIWEVIPNLVVGNPVIFKHSEECPLCGQFFEGLIQKADLPKGVFNEVYGDGQVGDFLVRQEIDTITFTGSTKVGKSLYQLAAKKFIPIHLELGGSAAGIVFEDVDLERVIESIYFNRFYNSGQVCDGLKRLIVHQGRFDEVVAKLKDVLAQKKVGDPIDPKTDMGPLVAKRQGDLLEGQVKEAIKMGAKIIYQREFPKNLKGAFYRPTILTNIKTKMRVWQEEVFGPVLPVISFKTEQEAIDLANDTNYGLGGFVFTEDKKRAQRVAKKLETGMVELNNASYVHPASPWGGYKYSGLGRGNGRYGLRELCQLKVVSSEK